MPIHLQLLLLHNNKNQLTIHNQNPIIILQRHQPDHKPLPEAKEKRVLELLLHLMSQHEVISDEDDTPRDKETAKLMALISTSFMKIYKPTNNNLKTSSNTRNKNVVQQTGIHCYNCKGFGHTTTECRSVKRVKDSSFHKDKMLLSDEGTGSVFDKEPLEQVHTNDEYNVFAMENEYPEQLESINDTYVVEQCDNNTNPDSSYMSNNGGEADQDEQKFQEERALFASLIKTLKVEIDENKKINKDPRRTNVRLGKALEKEKDMKYVKDVEYKCAVAYGLLEKKSKVYKVT
ncbi:gag-pol polyprotein [Tanacetum coccineum]